MYTFSQFNYSRRQSAEIHVGKVNLGGSNPVRIQSMANTDTNDIDGSVAQCLRIVDAGGEIVRFTTQGVREAESLGKIHEVLRAKGCDVPLVADIHFNANAADVAAARIEKVRVNPGNYVGSVKPGDPSDYTDAEYEAEFQKIRNRFIPLLNICKNHNTAVRIGVNHGSLSERMMNRYGDTPRGMVESCMEFLNICREQDFHDVVISMKTSNTVMMVQTVRLLVDEMARHDMYYPLHLGVTEAGDGEDGRIKSAVGTGALLADGIGDTVRVSLSEEPEAEIPVARKLVDYIAARENHELIEATDSGLVWRYEYQRRKTYTVGNIGGENVPVVIASVNTFYKTVPEYSMTDGSVKSITGEIYPVYQADYAATMAADTAAVKFVEMTRADLTPQILDFLKSRNDVVILLKSEHANPVGDMRAFFHTLLAGEIETPVILCRSYAENNSEDLQIKAAADTGVMLIDGLGDGILLENEGEIAAEVVNSVAFGILQAARVRTTKTEFISCPGCGRTMFNLQAVIARIKARTSHLKGLKIGIMGCIVNGPGEMADADYGYVGAGRGKVSLYKKKECVERNIPEEEAVEKLIELIKAHGDWYDGVE